MNVDGWIDPWPEHPTIRHFTPARNVLVDLDKVLNLAHAGIRADHVVLRVKATGIQITGVAEARQTAWVQSSDGSWLAILQVDVHSGNRKNALTLDLCVRADSVYPAPATGDDT